ncbi:MAG: ABC transporter substrate-binding protein [Peptococcaceae bacterium]|nr:ABC transporter substrate-binding protein [Peptococcaceae bacterium]
MKISKSARAGTAALVVIFAGALLLTGCGTKDKGQGPADKQKSSGAQRDYILIGRPNPTTGPLAGFGEGTPWAEERALAEINKNGGIYIKELNKKLPVKIKVVDTESNPTKAAEVASKLILEDKVDLMIALHTPDTVNPVDAICERYEVPCISLDAPVEAWLTGGPYKWSYHAFWTVDTLSDMFINTWDQVGNTNKVVGGLFPNDPDGKTFSEIFAKKLPEKGYKYVDSGRFPYGTKDFSSIINKFKQEKVEIVTGTMIPPDFATAWRQFHQQGFVPKIATVAKAYLFPSDAAALGGDLAQGLSAELWWSPYHPFKSSLTGETAKQLCDAYEAENKKQWCSPLGFKYAGIEIAVDVLNRAQSLDKNKIREAIEQTDLSTIVGKIKYNDQHYSETPLVTGQWVKGEKWPWEIRVVNNSVYPEIPTTAKFVFPLPK